MPDQTFSPDEQVEEKAIELAMQAYPGTTRAVWDHMEPWVREGYRKRARRVIARRKQV